MLSSEHYFTTPYLYLTGGKGKDLSTAQKNPSVCVLYSPLRWMLIRSSCVRLSRADAPLLEVCSYTCLWCALMRKLTFVDWSHSWSLSEHQGHWRTVALNSCSDTRLENVSRFTGVYRSLHSLKCLVLFQIELEQRLNVWVLLYLITTITKWYMYS